MAKLKMADALLLYDFVIWSVSMVGQAISGLAKTIGGGGFDYRSSKIFCDFLSHKIHAVSNWPFLILGIYTLYIPFCADYMRNSLISCTPFTVCIKEI